jgi:dihydroxyacetone kinase-like predicted kinase
MMISLENSLFVEIIVSIAAVGSMWGILKSNQKRNNTDIELVKATMSEHRQRISSNELAIATIQTEIKSLVQDTTRQLDVVHREIKSRADQQNQFFDSLVKQNSDNNERLVSEIKDIKHKLEQYDNNILQFYKEYDLKRKTTD